MGKLVVKIICGRNLKGSDMFSDCDGYIKLTLGSKTFRTKAIDNEANPNWNESFSFFVSEAACDKLKLELWDANTFKDDLITEAFVPLNDLIKDTRVLKRVNFPSGKGEVHLELLADFGAPGSAGPQSLSSSYSSLPTPYAPQQAPQAPTPPQAYANPYGGGGGGYSNPYAPQPQQHQQQPQPQYNYPGQNPYGGQNYYGGGPQQQQQQRPPQPPPPTTNGGYPSAASYAQQPGQYQNPYAQQHYQQPHQQGQPQQPQQQYQNPYATQYPGSAPSQYSYPGHAQQQRPPTQQGGGGPQVGGLGYMPGGNVGGVSYY